VDKLRELVQEIGNIDRISARAFINELEDINGEQHYLLLACCEEEVRDLDSNLVEKALENTHFEERAKKVMAQIEGAMVLAVEEYIKDKLADYADEDEARLEDFECARDTLPREMMK